MRTRLAFGREIIYRGRDMTETKVLSLALKVLGIYCVVRAIENVTILVQNLLSTTGFISVALFLAFAFVLIRYSDELSKKLLLSSESRSSVIQGNETQWYILTIGLIGIILLVHTVPSLISSLVIDLGIESSRLSDYMKKELVRLKWFGVLRDVLKIMFGLLLVLAPRRIAQYLSNQNRGAAE